MADIDLKRGAELAAKIIAEGGDWRDLDGLLNRALEEEGRFAPGLDKYYNSNVEIGADQADLQATETAKFQSDPGPDVTRLKDREETTEQSNKRRRREAGLMEQIASGGGETRSATEGAGGPQQATQRAIADEAYSRNLRSSVKADIDRVNASRARGVDARRGVFAGTSGQLAARRTEERTPPASGGRRVKSNAELISAMQDAIASGELSPEQEAATVRALRGMAGRADPRISLIAEEKAGRAAVKSSQSAFNPEKVRANRAAAGPIATESDRRALAGPDIGRIGEVVIGEVPGGYKDYISEVPAIISRQNDPQNFPDAIRVGQFPGVSYYDPETMLQSRNTSVALTGPMGRPESELGPVGRIPASNSATASEGGAVPGGASLLDMMEREQFSPRKSGTYPQVDIGGELALLTQRLNKIGVETPGGIRNLEQLQGIFDEAISTGQEGGIKFNAFGSKAIVDNPGSDELLAKMRYNEGERARLSNALIQLELGNRQNVNLDRKAAFQSGLAAYGYEQPTQAATSFDVVRNSPDPAAAVLYGPQNLSIAQRNATINQNARPVFGAREAMGDFNAGPEFASLNARVKPRMAELSGSTLDPRDPETPGLLEDAQRNYQALEKNEPAVPIGGKAGAPNYRYNRTGETSESGIRTALTKQAMERAKKTGKRVDMSAVEQNVINAVEVQRRSDNPPGPSQTEAPVSAEIAKRRAVADHVGRDKPKYTGRFQGASPSDRKAAVAESTGLTTYQNMGMPAAEPKRRIDDGIRNALAELNSGSYQGNPTRPLTDDLRGQLSALSGGRSDSYDQPAGPLMAGPNDPKATIGDRFNKIGKLAKNYATKDKYKNYRRGGYAAAGVGALASLIGGERDRREEAQY